MIKNLKDPLGDFNTDLCNLLYHGEHIDFTHHYLGLRHVTKSHLVVVWLQSRKAQSFVRSSQLS